MFVGLEANIKSKLRSSKKLYVNTDEILKIISEENARKLNPDYFFVMPYGFINEFLIREKNWLNKGGKFLLPYPKLKVVK
mgnify:CR=1 FL=1